MRIFHGTETQGAVVVCFTAIINNITHKKTYVLKELDIAAGSVIGTVQTREGYQCQTISLKQNSWLVYNCWIMTVRQPSVSQKEWISCHVWSLHWQITPFLLSQEEASRTCCLTSTPSKSLFGPVTGFAIGLFMLCQACHSVDPQWGHSSGDSLLSNCLAEELTEKWQPREACVYAWDGKRRSISEQALVQVCSPACVDLMCISVCPCTSVDILMSASVSVPSTYLLCTHKDGRPNWLFRRCRGDSYCGAMWSRTVIDTSQASFIDESLMVSTNKPPYAELPAVNSRQDTQPIPSWFIIATNYIISFKVLVIKSHFNKMLQCPVIYLHRTEKN